VGHRKGHADEFVEFHKLLNSYRARIGNF